MINRRRVLKSGLSSLMSVGLVAIWGVISNSSSIAQDGSGASSKTNGDATRRLPNMGRYDLNDLFNPPDIGGVWRSVSREMYERNPGDGALKGIVVVDPPDPRAEGGGIIMRIVQDGRNYVADDLVNATHDHQTHGHYIGAKQFFYQTTRVADQDNSEMVLNGVSTLLPNGRLETMVVGAIGGNLDHRDPPPNFCERREWERVSEQLTSPEQR